MDTHTPDVADLPVQRPAAPSGPAEARARFFNSGNAFNIEYPDVPARVFAAEARTALDGTAGTGFVTCDQSAALGCVFPATTPLVLARYAVIAAGETLTADFVATASIWYVVAGRGSAACAGERLSWGPGDVMLLPGGTPAELRADGERAVLWAVTNEPQLAFESSRPAVAGAGPAAPVHYPAAEIARQLALVESAGTNDTTSGRALIFSSDRMEASRNILPTLTLALNTLAPGAFQRPHRHNSVAVTLIVAGDDCHSKVDGERVPWTRWATMITPPGAPHSHHNDGAVPARFLIVQDGGLHYHARTMGFEFLA
jgi:gentisate 1,2-dioxygenase